MALAHVRYAEHVSLLTRLVAALDAAHELSAPPPTSLTTSMAIDAEAVRFNARLRLLQNASGCREPLANAIAAVAASATGLASRGDQDCTRRARAAGGRA